MIPEIEYFNARLRGMFGYLLPESLHETLLEANSRDAWIAALQNSPYGKFLGPSVERHDSRALYRAVDASIALRTHRLTSIVSGRPAKALRVCLAEQDFQNLITITSGIYNNISPLEILSGTLSGGLLGSDQLEALVRCSNIREAANLLSSWSYDYHRVYRRSLAHPEKKHLIELRLDFAREFMRILIADARGCGYPVIQRFMEEKVDRINLMTALMWRALPSDRDPIEFYVPGGPSITMRTFRRMLAASDLQEVIGCLALGSFKIVAEKASPIQGDLETISTFETSMEWQVIHRYSRPLGMDPLGAELLLAYLLRLRREGIRLKQSLTRLIFDIPMDVFSEMSGYV